MPSSGADCFEVAIQNLVHPIIEAIRHEYYNPTVV